MNGKPSPTTSGFNLRGSSHLGIALVFASALHAAILFGVDVEWGARNMARPAIDIVLDLDYALESTPASADSVTPDAAVSRTVGGPTSLDSQRRTAAGQDNLQTLLSASGNAVAERPDLGGQEARGPANIAASSAPDPRSRPAAGIGDLPYAELARAVANDHARRQRQAGSAGGAPRIKRLSSTSSKSAVEAAYLDMWQHKVERIGRANYPPGGISGELLLLAVIGHDGALREVRILESSGHAALDEAARRTVRLAAPYSHFPTEMRKSYDRLEIVRRWRFARNGAFF